MDRPDEHEHFRRVAVAAFRASGGSAARIEAAVTAASKTASPIEAIFAAMFVAARDRMLADGHNRYLLKLRPQVTVGRYRLDFAIEPMDEWLSLAFERGGIPIRLGVELDGHDYHERTKAQAIQRNQRDRDLSGQQWRILHFSGSELHRNPMAVVVEALVAGANALDDAKAALLPATSARSSVAASPAVSHYGAQRE